MSLGRLGIDLYANMASFTSDIGRAARISEQNAKKMERQWKQAGLAIAGAATAAAVAITGMVRAAARDADELAKVSQQIGITVERLSALKFAANQSGVEFNNLRSSIARLSRTAADAATGVGKPVAAFNALGVSVRDAQGQMKSTDALLSEIASKFATYEDGIAKTALAQELFGRSGAALIPMLNQGAAGIQELTEQAARLGLVINTETAQASERLNDNVAALRLTFDGFKNQLLQEIVPGLAAFSQQMLDSAESSNAMKSSATVLSNALKGVVVAFVFLTESIQLSTTTMAGFLDIVVNVFRAIKNVVLSQAQALGEALLAAVTLDPTGVRDAYARAGEVVSEEIDRVIGTVRFATGEIGRQFVEGLGDVRGAVDNLFGDLPEDIKDVGDNARRVQAPVLEMARSVDTVADAARDAERAMAKYEQIINSLLREFEPLEALHREYEESMQAVAEAVEKAGLSDDKARQARELLTLRYRESVAAIQSALTPAQELIAALDEEIRLLQMGNAERQVEIAMRGATVGMTRQQVAALREVATARMADIEAITAANAATEEANRQQQQLVSTISESLAEALLSGSKGFKNFAKQMLDMTKRMVAQMIAEFLRLRILGPLLGSMGGAGQAFAGSMGGGGFGGMGGMMGGGSGGGMMGSGMGQYGPMMAGISGAVYGFQNAGSGGASSLAAGAAYGGLAWTGATIGYGALLGGAAGAATGAGIGATLGGAASGAGGAAMAIPIIGWVLAIAALVDMFSGGKLFGTRFRPEDIESTIGIGAEGGTAGATMTEVRQRSLFRGRTRRVTDIDPGDDARDAATQFFMNVGQAMQAAAQQMSVDVIPVIDAQIRQITEYDKKGREKSTKIMVDVIGRTWEELTAEAAGMRVIGEAILAQVDSAIASGELASILAEPYRQTAEELMMFAEFAVRAAADVRNGTALIADSFEENVYITEELARAGETLTETYSRLLLSTQALRDGLELAGFDITNAGDEVVRFADALATAAGSAEEASRLWARYVEAFVDPVERTALQFQRAQAMMNESLAGIGLDPTTTAEQFRAAFEAALQTGLDPGSMVAWLRAGEAVTEFTAAGQPLRQMIAGMNAELDSLGAVDYGAMLANIVAQTRQNIQMAAAMGASESDLATIREYGIAQARALQEAQREADREYARFIEDIVLATEGVDPTGYISAMLNIERATEDAIRDANALAQAAGRQGASERDLAAIHRWAASQARAALNELRDATQSLIERLGYGRLSEIEAQIAALEGAQSSVFDGTIDGFQAAGQAGEDTAARWLAAVQSIHGWLDSIMLSDLSTLTPEQRLSEAQAQFDALVAAALGGDAEAASQLPGAASALLQEGRGFWASGDAYTTLFNSVRDAMAQVAGMAIPGSVGGVGGSYGGGSAAVASPELAALIAERDAMLMQQEAAQRVILAQQLAEHLAQLAEALGQPILEMAESMGVSMTQLAADLGIDLTEANAGVVAQLAGLAAMLGIDLATLAADVGISLGDLADSQSLLNDALELAIVGLPEEHADELAPLLRAVENAANTEESEAALAALNAATAALPAEYRNQLAPFLEGVDPLLEQIRTELEAIDLLTEVARLQISAIEATTAAVTALTLAVIPPMERVAAANEAYLPTVADDATAIRAMIAAQNQEQGLASYATGTMRVPRTGLYNLHEGESVWPRAVTEFFNREGMPSGGGDSSRIEDRLARIEEAIIRGSGQVTDAVKSDRMQSVDRVRYG